MTCDDLILTTALTLLGALIGLAIRWRLAGLSYRRDDEVDHPHPGLRWWIPVTVAAASGLLAWRFGVDRWPLVLPTLSLAWFGPWLSAIDLDVRRLPNCLLAVHGALVALGVGAAAIITGDLSIAIQAAVGGVVAFAVWPFQSAYRGYVRLAPGQGGGGIVGVTAPARAPRSAGTSRG